MPPDLGPVCDRLLVPKSAIGVIFGKSREAINRLEAGTGALAFILEESPPPAAAGALPAAAVDVIVGTRRVSLPAARMLEHTELNTSRTPGTPSSAGQSSRCHCTTPRPACSLLKDTVLSRNSLIKRYRA